MIKKLSVKNFKSIKELEIDCSGVNLFIGDPNTGKSNILETLGLLSWCYYGNRVIPLKRYVRLIYIHELFRDNLIDKPIEVYIEETEIRESAKIGVSLEYESEKFYLKTFLDDNASGGVDLDDFETLLGHWYHISDIPSPVKFYKFNIQEKYMESEPYFLMPPGGYNLLGLVLANDELKARMAGFFEDYGYELFLESHSDAIEFTKRIEDENKGVLPVVCYPYALFSKTIQKAIFYTIAIESNENSTLVFDNLGSGMAPEYVSWLGEKIALDDKNQYFIATHNPYLFLSILEKTKIDDLNVFITYTRDYQTQVKRLSGEEISEIMVYDPFANMDKFIDSEEVL